jgi:hypothetical protein
MRSSPTESIILFGNVYSGGTEITSGVPICWLFARSLVQELEHQLKFYSRIGFVLPGGLGRRPSSPTREHPRRDFLSMLFLMRLYAQRWSVSASGCAREW